LKHRTRYGEVIHRAALTLRQSTEGEDHIDAVIAVTKAIDVFLLEYGMTRSNYDGLQKNYSQARE
jgi:proteasome activator subunit 4